MCHGMVGFSSYCSYSFSAVHFIYTTEHFTLYKCYSYNIVMVEHYVVHSFWSILIQIENEYITVYAYLPNKLTNI